ncbi:nuclear transport factor 2 family protein [Azospirillum sp. ST 5-10]|uniref:nuclear transport factor 2 family protein n=1 Tax=unclassified Azospirillum TaxID=2630922 RepID=UPI003F49D0BE
MTGGARRDGLAAWVRFLETLTVENLDRLDGLTTPAVRFRDPFNDVRGRPAVRAVLAHTLDTCRDWRFAVSHAALADGLGLLRWRFTATVAVVGRLDVPGMSEVELTADGLVAAHTDHWDAGEHVYRRLPLLGGPLRLIRRRIAAPTAGRTG